MDAGVEQQAVFVSKADAFHPTAFAGGPWAPELATGCATLALLARTIERARPAPGLRLARLTFDLWRPVTLEPLTVELKPLREGKRANAVEASLIQGETTAIRCTALWMEATPGSIDFVTKPPSHPPGPETGRPISKQVQEWSRYLTGVETRVIAGDMLEMGPASAWFCMRRPLIAGEPNSPLMQAVSAADFSSGISAIADLRKWTFINADLTIQFWRDPEGEWILNEAETRAGSDGLGLATATLSDARGPFATATQSLLFAPRAKG